MASTPIRLSNYNIQPNARVIVSGKLGFANITHKNTKTQFTPTYGITVDNPTFSIPKADAKDQATGNNDKNLVRFLYAHEQREIKRHGKARLHLTWKDNGKLHGTHMPIAGMASQAQLTPVDAGDLLAKRDPKTNGVLNRNGEVIKDDNGDPVTEVNDVKNADDTVAFKSLASGQPIKVTFTSFGSKRYNNRLGSTIRALVVKDRDNLDLYNGQNSISGMGLTPTGDDTITISIKPDSNEGAAEGGKAPSGNPFANSSSAQPTTGSAPANGNNGNNGGNQSAPSSSKSNGSKPATGNGNKSSKDPNDDDLPF